MVQLTRIGLRPGIGGIGRGGGALPIGGYTIGEAGAPGSLWEGYTFIDGDDFLGALDIITPAVPRGAYATTRVYAGPTGAGPRGSDTALNVMYDVDPAFTGFRDANRGNAIGYSNMQQADSLISIQAVQNLAADRLMFQSPQRYQFAGMICSAFRSLFRPGAAGSADIIIDFRMKWTAAAGNPAGWHPTNWTFSASPVIAYTGDENDFEGTSQAIRPAHVAWAATVKTFTAGSPASLSIFDNAFHDISIVLNKTNAEHYVDGVLNSTVSVDANSTDLLAYWLMTCHVFCGTFGGENYSKSQWEADANGSTMTCDYWRVWQRTGTPYYRANQIVADVNVDFGGSTVITLPSQTAIWGATGLTEYVQAVMCEENEPGGSHSTPYIQFPAGVSYNAGTRELTVAPTSPNAGRLNFMVSADGGAGAGCAPLRFSVNFGPNVRPSTVLIPSGAAWTYDLYEVCDCGILVSNAAGVRTKTIAVSGLPAGLSYSDATGLITGTPSGTGNSTVSVTVTNSLGQVKQKDVTFTVEARPAYETWTGPGWFDASDAPTVLGDGTHAELVLNKRHGGGDLFPAGITANIQLLTNIQNGLPGIRATRDATDAFAYPRLVCPAGTPLSNVQSGDDLPYTLIIVWRPTTADSAVVASWSKVTSAVNSQVVGLVSRDATASSIRRQTTSGTTNDVNFGTGQAFGTSRITAIRHTGTAVTVWDNSTTASISGSAQNTGAFQAGQVFALFATQAALGQLADATSWSSQRSAILFELLVEDTAKDAADITQAMTDLATKWGITLS